MKYLPLLLSLSLLFCFFYFRLFHYLNLTSLAQYHLSLLQWKEQHYLLAVFLYILLYTIAATAAFPGTLLFPLAGGFLFGIFPGAIYVLWSAISGSLLLYLSVKLACADWFAKITAHWLQRLEQRLKKNAFYYLLILRLIPVFPFPLINIIAGLLAVPLPIFLSATALGLVPSAVIYTAIGKNLGIFLALRPLSLSTLALQPWLFLPLLALATLALLSYLALRFINLDKQA